MLSVLSKSFIRGNLNKPLVTPICFVTRRNLMQVEKESANKKKLTLQKYCFDKATVVVDYFEKKLEKKFPRTIQIYRIFSIGMKEFLLDVKEYTMLAKKIVRVGSTLTRKELQLTYTVPKNIFKLLPVMTISILPLAQYIMFPLAYKYPRQLLTSHFWTPQQKKDFSLWEHKKRLKHNKPLFRCVQAEVENIQDPVLKSRWKEVIACLGSGMHPSTEDIVACSNLFSRPPYSLDSLKKKHIKELLAIHGMPVWRPFKISSLTERGYLILQMDRAIEAEGGTEKMPIDALQWALFFRGVNSVDMSTESMQDWLNKWLSVSKAVNPNNISLILHAPILLAYNHPTNWPLIYDK